MNEFVAYGPIVSDAGVSTPTGIRPRGRGHLLPIGGARGKVRSATPGSAS